MPATLISTARASERLRFSTDSRWTVDDLSAFAQITAGMYDVLSGHLWEAEQRRLNPGAPHTLWHALTEPADWGESRLTYPGPTGIAVVPSRFNLQLYNVRSAVASRGQVSLQLGAIRMSSPGFISFAGLGEPLKQLRELIKDFWYRNAQERRRGELALEAAQLYLDTIRHRRTVPPGFVPRDALILATGLVHTATLESKGKITDVGVEDEQ